MQSHLDHSARPMPPIIPARKPLRHHGRSFLRPGATYPDCLGPMPVAALASLIDLGLSDPEIAAYFRLSEATISHLTQALRRDMTLA